MAAENEYHAAWNDGSIGETGECGEYDEYGDGNRYANSMTNNSSWNTIGKH